MLDCDDKLKGNWFQSLLGSSRISRNIFLSVYFVLWSYNQRGVTSLDSSQSELPGIILHSQTKDSALDGMPHAYALDDKGRFPCNSSYNFSDFATRFLVHVDYVAEGWTCTTLQWGTLKVCKKMQETSRNKMSQAKNLLMLSHGLVMRTPGVRKTLSFNETVDLFRFTNLRLATGGQQLQVSQAASTGDWGRPTAKKIPELCTSQLQNTIIKYANQVFVIL